MVTHRFLFPTWALHLNELAPELLAKLPPTDDRLRTDMRLFEHGYYIEASTAPKSHLWQMLVAKLVVSGLLTGLQMIVLHHVLRTDILPRTV